MDGLILSLLHRHREDLNPSGNPVPPLPNHGSSTPTRSSASRSSSLRPNFPSGPLTPTLLPRSSLRPDASDLGSPASQRSPRSAHASPWSSPKLAPQVLALSASASEFKFSAGAGEFVPGGGSLHAPGTASPIGSRPGTPLRAGARSPHPTINPLQAQANWAATQSPLGTPKFAPPGLAASAGPSSAQSSPSYFPRSLEAGVAARLQQHALKPRVPWADASDTSNEEAEDEEDEEDNPEPNQYQARRAPGHQHGAESPMWPAGEQGMYLPHQAYSESGAYTPNSHYAEQGWATQADPNQAGMVYPGGYAGGGWGYDPQGNPYGQADYQESYTPTFEGGGGMLLGGPGPGEAVSIDFANSLSGPSGLGGMGAYSMTPFDVLHSIFAGSNISAEVLEEALVMSGFDVDAAMEYIIETTQAQQHGGGDPLTPTGGPPAILAQTRATLMGSGSRPMIVSRDSFDGYSGGNGGRGSPMGPNRWAQRPQTPTGDGARGVGGRVCRYYLSGSCLRSDCKFSHDVGKAVCKFWLRGHCLKGDGRCDFLHSIPPIMRADFEQRARRRSQQPAPQPEPVPDEGPDLDFPTLGEAPRSRRNPIGGRAVPLDPTRSRFANALKMGAPLPPGPPQATTLGRPPAPPVPTRDSLPVPRQSGRLPLRAPLLMPTVPTGTELTKLYVAYRQCFLELGANRNKCLARAAEAWKRGDGAGAKRFSREAQDWNRQVAIEGRDSANRIVAERQRLLQVALAEAGAGPTEDGPDRKVRGQPMGGYGVCLGVVGRDALGAHGGLVTSDERTEVGLDLHALHTDEAVAFLGEFLSILEKERFKGLAFVLIGQAKHSGSTAPDAREAAGRLRLEQACTEFLGDSGFPWKAFQGTLAIDTLRT